MLLETSRLKAIQVRMPLSGYKSTRCRGFPDNARQCRPASDTYVTKGLRLKPNPILILYRSISYIVTQFSYIDLFAGAMPCKQTHVCV